MRLYVCIVASHFLLEKKGKISMQGFEQFSEVYCYKSNFVVQHICVALPCKRGNSARKGRANVVRLLPLILVDLQGHVLTIAIWGLWPHYDLELGQREARGGHKAKLAKRPSGQGLHSESLQLKPMFWYGGPKEHLKTSSE